MLRRMVNRQEETAKVAATLMVSKGPDLAYYEGGRATSKWRYWIG
jgi:hypothetical protein